MKGEAQKIYVRYLKVLTSNKTEKEIIKFAMKLSILIFLKSASISLAAFPLTFVNSVVQKKLIKADKFLQNWSSTNKSTDMIASFIYRAKKPV